MTNVSPLQQTSAYLSFTSMSDTASAIAPLAILNSALIISSFNMRKIDPLDKGYF